MGTTKPTPWGILGKKISAKFWIAVFVTCSSNSVLEKSVWVTIHPGYWSRLPHDLKLWCQISSQTWERSTLFWFLFKLKWLISFSICSAIDGGTQTPSDVDSVESHSTNCTAAATARSGDWEMCALHTTDFFLLDACMGLHSADGYRQELSKKVTKGCWSLSQTIRERLHHSERPSFTQCTTRTWISLKHISRRHCNTHHWWISPCLRNPLWMSVTGSSRTLTPVFMKRNWDARST